MPLMLASTVLLAVHRRFALHTDLHIPDSSAIQAHTRKCERAAQRVHAGDCAKLLYALLYVLCGARMAGALNGWHLNK
jgi:hypothetical protein